MCSVTMTTGEMDMVTNSKHTATEVLHIQHASLSEMLLTPIIYYRTMIYLELSLFLILAYVCRTSSQVA